MLSTHAYEPLPVLPNVIVLCIVLERLGCELQLPGRVSRPFHQFLTVVPHLDRTGLRTASSNNTLTPHNSVHEHTW